MPLLTLALLALASSRRPSLHAPDWTPDLMLYTDGMKWTWESEWKIGRPAEWPLTTHESVTLRGRGTDGGYNLFTATYTASNMDRYDDEWPLSRARSTLDAGGSVPPPVVEPILQVRFKQDRATREVVFEAERNLNSPKGDEIRSDDAGALVLPGRWTNKTVITGGLVNFVPSPRVKLSNGYRFNRDETIGINGKPTPLKVYRRDSGTSWYEYWVNPAWGNALRVVSGTGGREEHVSQLIELVIP